MMERLLQTKWRLVLTIWHHTIDFAFYSQFDFQLFNLVGVSKENFSFCSAGMLNILGQHYLSVEKIGVNY